MAGSLFEQSAFFFLEAVVLELYQQKKQDIDKNLEVFKIFVYRIGAL